MFGKILLVLALVFTISGCATLTEEGESRPASSGTVSPAGAETPRKAVFAPTYVSSESDTYFDAGEIYDSSPPASQGVYPHQGLVFVIVCIDTNKEQIEYPEGTAMLRTAALLREVYPGLPPKFHIRNRVVEKKLDDDTGIYRYATVYREQDILRKLKK